VPKQVGPLRQEIPSGLASSLPSVGGLTLFGVHVVPDRVAMSTPLLSEPMAPQEVVDTQEMPVAEKNWLVKGSEYVHEPLLAVSTKVS
jgi:hypothetical protein